MPSPARAPPSNIPAVPPSGTPGTPGTLLPAVVPNEKVAAVTMVFAVIPVILMVQGAVWFLKGVCGVFPSIEALALEYVPPGPGEPGVGGDGTQEGPPRRLSRNFHFPKNKG